MNEVFQESIDRIEKAYYQLGFERGWRFLFSPRATLSPETDLMVVGIHPAQRDCLPPTPSYEAGNRFRLDTETTSDRYRAGVQDIFRELAGTINCADDWPSVMDETLTSNFCPFPSSQWSELRRNRDMLEFCHRLWVGICSHLKPPTTICLGTPAFRRFQDVYVDLDFQPTEEDTVPAGWGDYTFSHQLMRRGDQTVDVFRLLNPSRFPIIGSELPERQRATSWFLQRVRSALENS